MGADASTAAMPVHEGEQHTRYGNSFQTRPFEASGDCEANRNRKMCDADQGNAYESMSTNEGSDETLSLFSDDDNTETPAHVITPEREGCGQESPFCPQSRPHGHFQLDLWPHGRREVDWSAQTRRRQQKKAEMPAPADEPWFSEEDLDALTLRRQ